MFIGKIFRVFAKNMDLLDFLLNPEFLTFLANASDNKVTEISFEGIETLEV